MFYVSSNMLQLIICYFLPLIVYLLIIFISRDLDYCGGAKPEVFPLEM